MSFFSLFFGFVLLVIGGKFLVRSSVALSCRLHISAMLIGLVVVPFATSVPELFISLQAAFNGSPDIAVGSVIGSNVAGFGLVLGITAFIFPIPIKKFTLSFYWPAAMLFSLLLMYLLGKQGLLSRWEGIFLLGMLILYLMVLVYRVRSKPELQPTLNNFAPEAASIFKIVSWFLIGGGALWGGSSLLIEGAMDLAGALGINDRVIALTVIAVGSILPELAGSAMAALKQEKGLMLGTLLGGGVFNIGGVLGITAMLQPLEVHSGELFQNDLFWMTGLGFVIFPLAILPKRYILGRLNGFILFAAFVAFISAVLFVGD